MLCYVHQYNFMHHAEEMSTSLNSLCIYACTYVCVCMYVCVYVCMYFLKFIDNMLH